MTEQDPRLMTEIVNGLITEVLSESLVLLLLGTARPNWIRRSYPVSCDPRSSILQIHGKKCFSDPDTLSKGCLEAAWLLRPRGAQEA